MFSDVIPLHWRIGNALVSYVAYLGQLFYPVGLAVLYSILKTPCPSGRSSAPSLVLIGISAAAWVGRRKCPYLLVGWLWYLGMLVPVIGLVQVGDQAMADRYTYLPLIGPCIALAWGAADVSPPVALSPLALRRCGGAGGGGLMGCAWRQTSFWYNSETLWKHTLTVTPRSVTVYLDLGTYYLEKGRLDEAIASLRKALAIKPDYPKAHNSLGLALARRGRTRRGHGPLPEGPEQLARLPGGQQQPRQRPGSARTARRGNRPLSEGAESQAELREGACSVSAWRWRSEDAFDEAIAGLQTVLKLNPDFPTPAAFWRRQGPEGQIPGRAGRTARHCSTRVPTTSLC